MADLTKRIVLKLRLPGLSRDSSYTTPTVQDRMMASLGQYRALHNLSALVRDPTLEAVANRRADFALLEWEQSGVLRHDDPDIEGDRYFELLPQFGIPTWNWAGEILALNNYADPVPVAMDGWDKSPTHHAILVGEWRSVGIGYSYRSPTGISVFALVFLD